MKFLCVSFAAFAAGAKHHEKLRLQPPVLEEVKSINDSFIVTCSAPNSDMVVRWRNPKNESVKERRGRIHTEAMQNSLALVFEHISFADRGEWSCLGEDEDNDEELMSSFKLIVYEEMRFVDTPIVQQAREHRDITIRCEVKGYPEPVISWDYNGQSIQFPHEKYIKFGDGLFIKKVERNDSGEYTCRGFQVSTSIVNSKEQRIRLNVQYKPILLSQENVQYIYMNGTANLTCEAEAEPLANFSWFRHGKKINPRQQTIHRGRGISQLEITLTDISVLGQYRCKAINPLGFVEHEILLKEGIKPEAPRKVALRGVGYNIMDVDINAMKVDKVTMEMDVTGYRIEIMEVKMFEEHDQDWTLSRQIDFPNVGLSSYLITDLQPQTRYILRAASRNLAGLSDFTDPREFSTESHDLGGASSSLHLTCPVVLLNIIILCHLQ
ncbi:Neural cell adhesion [Sergentomyia squamirostris]